MDLYDLPFLPISCCITSLDLSLSEYASVSYDLAENELGNNMPVAANGVNYCLLVSVDTPNALLGYYVLYIQEGKCVQGIVCGHNTISVYSSLNCSNPSTAEKYRSLDKNGGLGVGGYIVSSNYIGQLYVSYGNVSNATVSTQWKDYVPSEMLVPTFKVYFEFSYHTRSLGKLLLRLSQPQILQSCCTL